MGLVSLSGMWGTSLESTIFSSVAAVPTVLFLGLVLLCSRMYVCTGCFVVLVAPSFGGRTLSPASVIRPLSSLQITTAPFPK